VGEVRACLTKYYGQGLGQDCASPLGTLTTKDRFGLVQVDVQPPAPLDRSAEVRALLARFRPRPEGFSLDDWTGLLTEAFLGEVVIRGEVYVIADIGMRMLTPRERYRGQGFPDSYKIDIEYNGKPLTQEAQGRMCGNSVCPPVAAALVRANYSSDQVQVRTRRDQPLFAVGAR
jgi:DNA (cytosine-5)-methyltransferase 1